MGILRQRMRTQKVRVYYHQHLVSNHKDLPPHNLYTASSLFISGLTVPVFLNKVLIF